MFALLFLLPIYLQVARHDNAFDAGLQLLPLTGGIVIGATINGRYSARTGTSGRLPPWGLAAGALAIGALAVLPPMPGLITTVAAICGTGFGVVMPSAQIATQILAGRDRLGAAAALLSLTRSLGATLGTAAFGGLAFVLLGGTPTGETLQVGDLDPVQVTIAFHIVFGVLAAFTALAALASWPAPSVDLRQRAAA
jgi:hypothetical protein